MTHDQNIKLGKAIRKCLQIGDKVLVILAYTTGDRLKKEKRRVHEMYVRELHNAKTAGLSHAKDSTVYGILYSIIHPL